MCLLFQVLEITFIFLNVYLYAFIWLCWVSMAAWAFSSCGKQGLLFVEVHELLWLGDQVPGLAGFPSCGFCALQNSRGTQA